MKKIILLFILVIIVITLIGYFSSKFKKDISDIRFKGKTTTIPSTPVPQPPSTSTSITKEEKYQIIFNQPVLYISLDYPDLYFYDPKESSIKYFNLENKKSNTIAKIKDITSAKVSPDKQKFILEINDKFYLLDRKKDILTPLPANTKNFEFDLDKILVYLVDYNKFSYLAILDQNNKPKKIRDLGLIDPEITFLAPNLFFLYNKEGLSPIFLIDLKNPSNMDLFLEAKEDYSVLPNKKGDLIFVSSKEGSKVINRQKETLTSFSWQTTKEKCSFDDVLICGVSESFSYKDWHLFNYNLDNKIIIYDPAKNSLQEINLEEKFDIIKPKLTPLGLIFGSRLDGKIYNLKR